MSHNVCRLAIILADKDLPVLIANQQTLPRLFSYFFKTADYQIDYYDALAQELPNPPDAYDACLITGSKFSVLQRDAWADQLIEFIRAQQYRKLIGVCYGHQLIGLALGGQVERIGWHIGTLQIRWTNPTNFTKPFLARFNHEDQVVSLPPNSSLLATSDYCQNTLFEVNKKILCMQFHPEFTQPYHQKLLETRYADKLSAKENQLAQQKIKVSDNKTLLYEYILNFIREKT